MIVPFSTKSGVITKRIESSKLINVNVYDNNVYRAIHLKFSCGSFQEYTTPNDNLESINKWARLLDHLTFIELNRYGALYRVCFFDNYNLVIQHYRYSQ